MFERREAWFLYRVRAAGTGTGTVNGEGAMLSRATPAATWVAVAPNNIGEQREGLLLQRVLRKPRVYASQSSIRRRPKGSRVVRVA